MTDLISELGIDRQKLSMVRVTNRNAFTMRDRFDGNLYTFRPNKPEIIPPLAATHMFGWPGEDAVMKLHTTRRFGWNTPKYVGMDKNRVPDIFDNDETLGDVYWRNLRIEEIGYKVVPEDPNLPEKEEAPPAAGEAVRAAPGDDLTHAGVGRKARKVEL